MLVSLDFHFMKNEHFKYMYYRINVFADFG